MSVCIRQNGRWVHLIWTESGHFVPTGCARGWERCKRCRRPSETLFHVNDGRRVCAHCYFYKFIDLAEFFRLHDTGFALAPYNMGRRAMNALSDIPKDWFGAEEKMAGQWRPIKLGKDLVYSNYCPEINKKTCVVVKVRLAN